jgi:outer membrane biosynthesis protein TonB
MLTFASAIVVAFSVATSAHAQASAKATGPQSCPWMSGGIPDDHGPSPQRIIVAPSVAAAALISRVEPDYRGDAGSEGTVLLCAIIAQDGTIERLQYVSGPVPRMRAAMDAVRQWRYKRTLLNGDPVEVETRISVTFTPKKRSVSETSAAAPTR